jgi:hypothetical protein
LSFQTKREIFLLTIENPCAFKLSSFELISHLKSLIEVVILVISA